MEIKRRALLVITNYTVRIMNRWICWLKTIWRSLEIGYPMSGHTYQDLEYHKGCDVTVNKCEMCGDLDISWSGGREVDKL